MTKPETANKERKYFRGVLDIALTLGAIAIGAGLVGHFIDKSMGIVKK